MSGTAILPAWGAIMTNSPQNQEERPERVPFHVEFSEKIIKMLEEGTAPWQMPWQPAQNMAPRNPLSGTVYRGSNRLWLSLVEMAEGYDDPRWMTLKQANDAGFRIRKGERSATVVYWQFTREQDRLDDAGNPVLGADGKPERETVELDRPIMRLAHVFNAKQVEDFPPLPAVERKFEWDPHEKAEAILENSGAVIKNDQRDRAYYTIVDDEIHLPPKEAFDQAGKYYATALHELGHWTRHPTRLNRENGPYGSAAYAKEELRAEISSWMVGQDIGIGHDPGQHAAYVQSWIEALRDDPLEILRACRDAEKIRDYMLGLEHQKEKELPLEKRMEVFIRETLLHMEYKVALADIVQEARQALESGSPEAMQNAFTNVFQAVKSEHFTGPRQLVSRGEEILKELNARSMAEEQNRSLPHEPAPAKEKTWLHVPFREKDVAKALGARWDRQEKLWYAPEGTDLTPLRRFMSPHHDRSTGMTLDPREEFAAKLADLGLDLKGSLPELDGKMHRVPLLGKNGRGQDGAYCLYGDGVPAGWAQNHVTGEKVKLVATGVVLSPEERERQQRERTARIQQAAAERAREQDAAARRCQELWSRFNEVGSASHPYLQGKGVEAHGLKYDPIRGNLIIPLKNVEGELRGFQAISPEGQKAFASGIQKRGNFHLIGGIGQELSKSEILICEGYATGASLHMASGKPVVVAFDSGNLAPVAEALRAKYPQAALTICADNDHALMLDYGKPYNVGHEKAKLAAEKVAAKVLLPKLTAKEKAQGLTDFNDLHKSRGLAEVKKQLGIRDHARGTGRGQEVGA